MPDVLLHIFVIREMYEKRRKRRGGGRRDWEEGRVASALSVTWVWTNFQGGRRA